VVRMTSEDDHPMVVYASDHVAVASERHLADPRSSYIASFSRRTG
jgi:hypothetical protein